MEELPVETVPGPDPERQVAQEPGEEQQQDGGEAEPEQSADLGSRTASGTVSGRGRQPCGTGEKDDSDGQPRGRPGVR